jgi:nucleoside-diphosphate-sugar epimerase
VKTATDRLTVAVTGAAGYIGGWLCPELQSRGHEVCAQDIRPPGGVSDWDSWHSFDLHGPERAAWLDRIKPDAVIHLAALYGRVWGEQDLAETARVNAGLTAALARDCAQRDIRLMYVSSSEVYGTWPSYRGPLDGTSPLGPLNMYGLSKKWGEEAARLYCPDGLMITRLNMPYGPPAVTPLPGEIPATSGRVGPLGYNALHTMSWQASRGMPITVHKGTERCFTWAGDMVRGMALILESGLSGTWNVCRDDDQVPMAELARRIVAAAGTGPVITEQDPPPGVTPRKDLSGEALLRLGWKPEIPLDEGIRRCLEHFGRYDETGVWRG